jgi:glycosyltransferase involved in cell wall biosynthesis
LKVAVVYPGIDPEEGGGFTFLETVVEALREAEPTTRHEFVHYTLWGAHPGVYETRQIPSGRLRRLRDGAIRLLRAVQDFLGMRRWAFRTWFERSLEEEGVDLVWFATSYAEECDVPFIFTVLDLAHVEQPWYPEISRDGEWERRQHRYSRFLSKASAVVVPNEAGERSVKRHFPVRGNRILRLPHPTPRFALQAGDDPGTREVLERHRIEGPYLFYPAQFWAHKNHYTLLEAIAELERRDLRYRAVCVGSDRGQLQYVHDVARRLSIEDRVSTLGFVEPRELIALYRHAHALVFLSLFGPENLPPLEAFALGCPVVAADVPGAREQMGDAALLVPATDAAKVADAVERLDDRELRTELGERGRRRAEERTGAGYVQGVLEFLDEFERIRRSWPMNETRPSEMATQG